MITVYNEPKSKRFGSISMDNHNKINVPTLSDILSLTKWTENYINNKYSA